MFAFGLGATPPSWLNPASSVGDLQTAITNQANGLQSLQSGGFAGSSFANPAGQPAYLDDFYRNQGFAGGINGYQQTQFNEEVARQQAAAQAGQAFLAQRQMDEQQRQSAYNTSLGSNYAGGVINDTYGQSTMAMPRFDAGAHGTPLPSPTQIGGQYSYMPAAAPSQMAMGGKPLPSSWGGPFSNVNPFGLSK